MIDENLVAYYFSLNNRIAKIKNRLKEMRIEFYQQTMSSYCTSDEEKMYTKGFPVEKKVITLVDAEAKAKKRMEIMVFKQKHFLKYLKQLPKADRYLLTHKYKWREGGLNDRVERDCFEEIQEIEEATGFRFEGYEPGLVEVEIVDITEASEQLFEDNFMKMCSMLGV